MGVTDNYDHPFPEPEDFVKDAPAAFEALADSIDAKHPGYSQGTLGSLPTSTPGSPGIAGRTYRATDTGQVFKDTGTGWVEVLNSAEHAALLGLTADGSTRRGKSIIAAEESRSNTAYGLMGTADRVSGIVLPTDGLIVVGYQALWKSSVAQAARAAIFIGANQLSFRDLNGTAPLLEDAFTGLTANRYEGLSTVPTGLTASTHAGADMTSDVTTGQSIGVNQGAGGPCYIFAAAGTYDISVQFKASSGSVTVKERKLWVWTMGF